MPPDYFFFPVTSSHGSTFARFAHALEVLGEYWTGVAKLPPTAA